MFREKWGRIERPKKSAGLTEEGRTGRRRRGVPVQRQVHGRPEGRNYIKKMAEIAWLSCRMEDSYET